MTGLIHVFASLSLTYISLYIFLFLSVGKENYITLALDESQVVLSSLYAIENI